MPGALIPGGKLPGAAADIFSGKLHSPVGSPVSTIWHKKGKKTDDKVTDEYAGIVFEDKNGNGKQDSGEKGLAGIRVSDGISVIKTANDGSFKIRKNAAARFIFATRPAGYKCSTPFFKAVGDGGFNFGFTPVPKRPPVFYQVTDTEARGPEAWLAETTIWRKRERSIPAKFMKNIRVLFIIPSMPEVSAFTA